MNRRDAEVWILVGVWILLMIGALVVFSAR